MKLNFNKIDKKIKISKKITISNKDRCFVVAEISANHGGDLNILKKTMMAAKRSGADAVKIQSYEADTITLKSKNKNFLINDKSIWKNQNLYNLYKKPKHHSNGIRKYFHLQKKIIFFAFQHHLIYLL